MYTDENGYISNKSLKNKVEEIVEYCKELDLYVHPVAANSTVIVGE